MQEVGQRLVNIHDAIDMIVEFVKEADADTIASIFSGNFGYDVTYDIGRETFTCTPDDMCGFRLDEADYLVGKAVKTSVCKGKVVDIVDPQEEGVLQPDVVIDTGSGPPHVINASLISVCE